MENCSYKAGILIGGYLINFYSKFRIGWYYRLIFYLVDLFYKLWMMFLLLLVVGFKARAFCRHYYLLIYLDQVIFLEDTDLYAFKVGFFLRKLEDLFRQPMEDLIRSFKEIILMVFWDFLQVPLSNTVNFPPPPGLVAPQGLPNWRCCGCSKVTN